VPGKKLLPPGCSRQYILKSYFTKQNIFFFGIRQLVRQREWWDFLFQRPRMSGTSEERTGSLERPLEQEIPALPRRHVKNQFKSRTGNPKRPLEESLAPLPLAFGMLMPLK
jgi:hypothetical protein